MDPNDERLKIILNFRNKSYQRDEEKKQRSEQRVKQFLVNKGILNSYAQAFILRKIGAVHSVIIKVTGLKHNDYYTHIGVLFRSKRCYGRLGILDVEAALKEVNLYKLLEDM